MTNWWYNQLPTRLGEGIKADDDKPEDEKLEAQVTLILIRMLSNAFNTTLLLITALGTIALVVLTAVLVSQGG